MSNINEMLALKQLVLTKSTQELGIIMLQQFVLNTEDEEIQITLHPRGASYSLLHYIQDNVNPKQPCQFDIWKGDIRYSLCINGMSTKRERIPNPDCYWSSIYSDVSCYLPLIYVVIQQRDGRNCPINVKRKKVFSRNRMKTLFSLNVSSIAIAKKILSILTL